MRATNMKKNIKEYDADKKNTVVIEYDDMTDYQKQLVDSAASMDSVGTFPTNDKEALRKYVDKLCGLHQK